MIVALLVLILLALLFPGFMRMVALGLLLIIGFAAAQTARADEAPFPLFDPNQACERIFGQSRLAFNHCIDIEQTTYKLLKASWGDLSAATKIQCASMITRLHEQGNPYVYQNTYELSQVLTYQDDVRRSMAAPKRHFTP
ncbi:hypothetical protein LB518_22720 [Mesorhizobium sp. BR1-1-16]|uniref:hypothetical protein n=1 Tax=Mesorhizobium sp. BR1-1-16 TaxID=2876653 RepID=UPI001CCE6FB8|nr:hypothetical protein [Mesorhizobium sp. BR1-1-16]MBZ9939128.1 hypothetical protein [Mesorhizobium sp. BR1-1-16]